MFDRMKAFGPVFLLGLLAFFYGASGASAQDAVWHVGKSSGEVWVDGRGGAARFPSPMTQR